MSVSPRRFVDRISYRGGKKKAIVALVRKLATIIFCVLKEEREYIQNYQPVYWQDALRFVPLFSLKGQRRA